MSLAIVSVGFDEETPALVKSAVSLARRTGIGLRFVHVIETVVPAEVLAGMPLYGLSGTLVRDALEYAQGEREEAMRALVAGLPADVQASWSVGAGEVVATLLQEAGRQGANLVMTACNVETYRRLMPRGLSVALRLMAEAPIPVLVVSREAALELDAKRVSILLADDLQPGAEAAARRAFEIAAALGDCRVRHLHVHGDFREALRTAFRAAGKDGERALEAEQHARVSALAARGGAARDRALQSGVVVEPEVVVGSVLDRMDEAIRDAEPDLVVFGRHRTLKARPFLIGRMGLRAMLAARRPVLVVPPEAGA